MKWLTPLVDHDQIKTTLLAAPSHAAIVLIRCGDGWQAPLIWRAAPMDPDTLGDYDGEADEIASTITGPYVSPVIVLRDPTSRYRAGCTTQSHFTGKFATATAARHIDCDHALVSRLLHPGRSRSSNGGAE